METIIVSIVSMALIIISTLTVTVSTLQSANRLAEAWTQLEERSVDSSQTHIEAHAPMSYTGGVIVVQIDNDGNTSLRDYDTWDVILQYEDGQSVYLTPATDTPQAGQWTVEGRYIAGGRPEVFDVGIFDPGEEMVVAISPPQDIPQGEVARVTISTPAGVTSRCFVTRS
jgi:hypothetical protein